MKENLKSLVSMITIMVFSLVLYCYIIPNYIAIRESVSGNINFTSNTWPKIISIILFILSTYGTIKYTKLFLNNKKESDEKININLKEFVRPALAFIIVLAYALLFINLGTIISSVICVPILLYFNGTRKPLEYVYVGVFCTIMYFVFTQILLIPLP